MTTTNKKNAGRKVPFKVVDLKTISGAEERFGEKFDSRLIGQPEARQIAMDIRTRYKNPLRSLDYPLGIYYCVGKSRRGKSLLGQVLAWMFHGDKDALIRITAEDYHDDSQMSDLTGATPKYVGHRNPVDLRRMPRERLMQVDGYSKVSEWNRVRVRINSKEYIDVVVIEEMEKAGPDFFKFWMEVFDKGRKTLGNGEMADFRNTVFIITSNIGMRRVEKEEKGGIGFGAKEKKLSHEQIVAIVNQEMERFYPPEFRNRLDSVIVYRELTREGVSKVVDIECDKILERVVTQMPRGEDFSLEIDPSAREFLLNQTGGEVAELKRVLENKLVTPMGRILDEDNPDRVRGGDLVRVSWDGKSEDLTVEIARGYGDVDDNLEGLDVHGGDTMETMRGLAMQRRIAKARMRASRENEKEWTVTLLGVDKDDFQEEAAGLIHDLKELHELRVKSYFISEEAPYTVMVVVVATEEQLKVVHEYYPEMTYKEVARAQVPAKRK